MEINVKFDAEDNIYKISIKNSNSFHNNSLIETRQQLLNIITFPFTFLDKNKKEIQKEKESETLLKNIIKDNFLYLKKEKTKNVMLGKKVLSKNGLDFYEFPKIQFTKNEKDSSFNMMVIGYTGMGKTTWLNCFINYLQNIQFENKERYILKIEDNHRNDKPFIYDIESTKLFNNPLRLIDTPGFGDFGHLHDQNLIKEVKDFLKESKINTINTLCLFFNANHERGVIIQLPMLYNYIYLFGKEIKINNIIIIFTFAHNFEKIPALEMMKDKNGIFYKILGDIDKYPYFAFNNGDYFCNDLDYLRNINAKNRNSFRSLLEYIISLKSISLKSDK